MSKQSKSKAKQKESKSKAKAKQNCCTLLDLGCSCSPHVFDLSTFQIWTSQNLYQLDLEQIELIFEVFKSGPVRTCTSQNWTSQTWINQNWTSETSISQTSAQVQIQPRCIRTAFGLPLFCSRFFRNSACSNLDESQRKPKGKIEAVQVKDAAHTLLYRCQQIHIRCKLQLVLGDGQP